MLSAKLGSESNLSRGQTAAELIPVTIADNWERIVNNTIYVGLDLVVVINYVYTRTTAESKVQTAALSGDPDFKRALKMCFCIYMNAYIGIGLTAYNILYIFYIYLSE